MNYSKIFNLITSSANGVTISNDTSSSDYFIYSIDTIKAHMTSRFKVFELIRQNDIPSHIANKILIDAKIFSLKNHSINSKFNILNGVVSIIIFLEHIYSGRINNIKSIEL